jgi:hypothetical protein
MGVVDTFRHCHYQKFSLLANVVYLIAIINKTPLRNGNCPITDPIAEMGVAHTVGPYQLTGSITFLRLIITLKTSWPFKFMKLRSLWSTELALLLIVLLIVSWIGLRFSPFWVFPSAIHTLLLEALCRKIT